MRIILTRHGRTKENDAGILQGQLPGVLSEKGWDQARRIAERLKSEKIDYIYSSDLDRSANTTKEIIRFHQETPVEFTKDLREAFLGDWQGKTKNEIGLLNNPEADKLSPNEFESPEVIEKRARNFLEKIKLKHSHETILCVGHDGLNKKLIGILTGKEPIETMKNTSISIFNLDEMNQVTTILFNCTKHLD